MSKWIANTQLKDQLLAASVQRGEAFLHAQESDEVRAARHARRIKRKNNRKRRGLSYTFPRSKRRRILKRDGYVCLKCRESDVEKLTLDHIDPRADGDKNRDDNLQTLCEKCNQRKGQEAIDYRPKDFAK